VNRVFEAGIISHQAGGRFHGRREKRGEENMSLIAGRQAHEREIDVSDELADRAWAGVFSAFKDVSVPINNVIEI